MARKSNKTAHVLSLLTDPKHDTAETNSVETPQTTPAASASVVPQSASAEAASTETVPAQTAQPNSTSVSPESAPSVPTPAPQQAAQTVLTESLPPSPSPTFSPIDSAQAAEERLSKRIQSSLADALLAEEESMPPPAPAPKPPAPRPQHTTVAMEPQKTLSASEQQAAPSEPPSPQFVLVNVMDELVERFQDDIMRKFEMCTCERCRLDTRALALSNLTGKYVVLNADSVCAMLNFYENRYQSTITAQLTQACKIVMQNPHHTNPKKS